MQTFVNVWNICIDEQINVILLLNYAHFCTHFPTQMILYCKIKQAAQGNEEKQSKNITFNIYIWLGFMEDPAWLLYWHCTLDELLSRVVKGPMPEQGWWILPSISCAASGKCRYGWYYPRAIISFRGDSTWWPKFDTIFQNVTSIYCQLPVTKVTGARFNFEI